MKHFFVIGNKVSKSLSPLIFNHWFKKYNIKAKYFFVEVSKASFDRVLLELIYNKKTYGLNITIPFKKDVVRHLDKTNNHAKKIGAVNCVTLGKKIVGINTDWLGYLNSIKSLKIKKNKKILILGYGGASQAIIYGLTLKGFTNITVFNRSKKLINVAGVKKFTKKYPLIENHLSVADLIINTTPTNPLNRRQTKLVGTKAVLSDIVYKPKKTVFLNSFVDNKKIYGISMLIAQAIPCFNLWFGFEPKVDDLLIKKLNLKIK